MDKEQFKIFFRNTNINEPQGSDGDTDVESIETCLCTMGTTNYTFPIKRSRYTFNVPANRIEVRGSEPVYRHICCHGC